MCGSPIVDIKFIEPEVPHSGRRTITDPHTVEVTEGEGREWEERTDGVTDRRKR